MVTMQLVDVPLLRRTYLPVEVVRLSEIPEDTGFWTLYR